MLYDIIDDHENTFDENNLRDFIDIFLKEMKNGNDPNFSVSLI